MKCTTPHGIRFTQGRSIGGFPTVVVPDDHLRMVFPLPAQRARTADGVYLLAAMNGAPGPNNGSNPSISRSTLRRKAMFAP